MHISDWKLLAKVYHCSGELKNVVWEGKTGNWCIIVSHITSCLQVTLKIAWVPGMDNLEQK